MAVQVDDIRRLLDRLASKQVGSSTIQENIVDALALVDRFASSSADAVLIESAHKRIAVWLSYLSYAEGQSFQQGATPLISETKIKAYRDIAELYLNLVSDEPIDLEDIKREDKALKDPQLPIIDFTGTTAFD